jgi:hypothetical protein
MRSQVSGEGEVELKCFRVFEISKASPSTGRAPSLPFIDQEKDLGYIGERKRGKEAERKGPRGHAVLLLLQAGPAGLVDDDRDVSTS